MKEKVNITYPEVIDELERELKFREKVFPRLIDEGKMSIDFARKRYRILKRLCEKVKAEYREKKAKKEPCLFGDNVGKVLPKDQQGKLAI